MIDHPLLSIGLLALLFVAAPANGAEQAEAPGIAVTDQSNRIEFRLPAPYWDHEDRQDLAERISGGCMGRQLPPGLLHVATHQDAGAFVQLNEGSRRFLMRNREDLETFVNGTVQAVTDQISKSGEVLSTEWQERNGMIIHRFSFKAAVGGGGGCMAPGGGGGEQRTMRWLFVDIFLRPEGEDAVNYQMRCMAPDEAFEALRPEIDFIVSSFHYTGTLAEEFFVPDATADKVPTAEEAAESVKGDGGLPTWLMLGGLFIVIWMLLRRKKEKASA
ncbi:MAG: hypothetical protein ACOC7S_00055 [Planctomycetota bacterium]